MSMKTISLKETKAPYSLSLDEEQLGEEPAIIERDGQPVAVLVPFHEYQEFARWRAREVPSHLKPAELEQFERDHLAFERLREELLQTHRGQFVAILNGQVVDADPDQGELAKRVYAKFGYRPIYMDEVREKPYIYHIPGPRLVR
jgi:antitoxin (DNA-binding transcriptional repressor) of toxin-antitoxin stability system